MNKPKQVNFYNGIKEMPNYQMWTSYETFFT